MQHKSIACQRPTSNKDEEETMNTDSTRRLPGFSAESSIYRPIKTYTASAGGLTGTTQTVVPQSACACGPCILGKQPCVCCDIFPPNCHPEIHDC